MLVRAVAGSLGIAPLDLPWAEGPRLWPAEDIAAHLPLFKEFAAGAQALAKAGDWDESKHPRWPIGSPDHANAEIWEPTYLLRAADGTGIIEFCRRESEGSK